MSEADALSLKSWLLWYEIGAWFVIIGVILEGAEVFFRWKSKWKPSGFSEPWHSTGEPHVPKSAHIIGDFGFILLVAGLLIEQVAHTKMSAITDRESARLAKEAADTRLEASKANERAEKLEQTNLVLRTDFETLNKSVIELAHQYDMSTNALAEANRRLSTILPPRNISKEQQLSLFKIVSTLPKMKVSIFTDQGVPDGKALVEKIAAVFKAAEWELGTLNAGIFAGVGNGIKVEGRNSEGLELKVIADALTFLELNGYAVTNQNAKIETKSIRIVIGYNRKSADEK